VSVIDRPHGVRKMTLFPFRLDSVQRLGLKIELPQSFQAAGPVHGVGTWGFPVGRVPRPWKGKCIPGSGQRLQFPVGQRGAVGIRHHGEETTWPEVCGL